MKLLATYILATFLEYLAFIIVFAIFGALTQGFLRDPLDGVVVVLVMMLLLAFWHYFRVQAHKIYRDIAS